MANLFPGYRGIANIGAVGQVRFSSADITARQEINAPELISGGWDRMAYNYGPVTVEGTISGPVTETFVSGASGGSLWDWAVKRSAPCGLLTTSTVDLYYYCGTPDEGNTENARLFSGMLVNSVNFSVTAGEAANFSINVMGSTAGPWRNDVPPLVTASEKITTWDKVNVSITQLAGHETTLTTPINFQSFDFTISNNLQVNYAMTDGQENLFPFEITPGIRNIDGTLTAYNIPLAVGADSYDDYNANSQTILSFDIGGLEISMRVQLHRVQASSSTGIITSTIGFTGVGYQSGSEWIN